MILDYSEGYLIPTTRFSAPPMVVECRWEILCDCEPLKCIVCVALAAVALVYGHPVSFALVCCGLNLILTRELWSMSPLDLFALFVLLVLLAAAVTAWVVLGMLPGKIARKRQHPQADAITVCGWWGVITMGLLLPLAFIWAYINVSPATTERNGTSDH